MSTEHPQAPHVLSLVVCDEVIEDILTRKKSLIGLFNRISADRFPSIHPQMVVYLAISGHGTAPIRVELVDANDLVEEEGPLFRIDQEGFEFKDPNAVVEFVFKLNGVQFSHPGLYMWRVLSDNHLLCYRNFQVQQMPGSEEQRREKK